MSKPLPAPIAIDLTNLTTTRQHDEQQEGEVFLGLFSRIVAEAAGWMTGRTGAEITDAKSPRRYPLFVQAHELEACGVLVAHPAAALA